jgi:hypothetical protein
VRRGGLVLRTAGHPVGRSPERQVPLGVGVCRSQMGFAPCAFELVNACFGLCHSRAVGHKGRRG